LNKDIKYEYVLFFSLFTALCFTYIYLKRHGSTEKTKEKKIKKNANLNEMLLNISEAQAKVYNNTDMLRSCIEFTKVHHRKLFKR
jgi:hypothetical protein